MHTVLRDPRRKIKRKKLNMHAVNDSVLPVPLGKIKNGTKESEKAVWEVLNYIKTTLGFSGSEIARLIHLPPTTVNNWLSNKRVPIGKPPFSPETQAILHFIAIHRSLTAMFLKPENQLAWLKTKHPVLGVIPLEKIKESIEGLLFIRQYLDYVRGRGA